MKEVLTKFTCDRCGDVVELPCEESHSGTGYFSQSTPSGWLCLGNDHLCRICSEDYIRFKGTEEK